MTKTIETLNDLPKGRVLLYIGTSWCKYCSFTKPAAEEIAKERPDLQVLFVDGDENPDLPMDVGLKTYPTLIEYEDGAEIRRRGSAQLEDLRAWLDEPRP